VRVQPRSSRSSLEVKGDTVKVWTTAAPTDGQANAAVCNLIAKRLGVAPGRVQIIRGQTSRNKTLRIEGMLLSEALARLGGEGSS